MNTLFLLICYVTAVVSAAENDGWVWKDGVQAEDRIDKSSYRYQVTENLEDLDERPLTEFRPPNQGSYGPNNKPVITVSFPGNKEVLVGPGGPTGIIKRPSYAGNIDEAAINSGYVPSWIKEDPRYRDYDVCKCRYSFNCPSSGLKFGSCSKDKKYCCFSSKKYPALVSGQFGGQYPPLGGIPNKYGPGSFVQPPNYYGNRRPLGIFGNGNRYPGNYYYPPVNTNPYGRPFINPNVQNYDYNDFDAFSRSSKINQTDSASADDKA